MYIPPHWLVLSLQLNDFLVNWWSCATSQSNFRTFPSLRKETCCPFTVTPPEPGNHYSASCLWGFAFSGHFLWNGIVQHLVLWLAVFVFHMFWGASTLLRLSFLFIHFCLLLNGDSAPSSAWIPLGWTFGQVPFLWQISQGL